MRLPRERTRAGRELERVHREVIEDQPDGGSEREAGKDAAAAIEPGSQGAVECRSTGPEGPVDRVSEILAVLLVQPAMAQAREFLRGNLVCRPAAPGLVFPPAGGAIFAVIH